MTERTISVLPQEGWTAVELHASRDALRQSLRHLEAIHVTCAHCRHFDMDYCHFYRAAVPAEFQKTEDACPDWSYDSLPF